MVFYHHIVGLQAPPGILSLPAKAAVELLVLHHVLQVHRTTHRIVHGFIPCQVAKRKPALQFLQFGLVPVRPQLKIRWTYGEFLRHRG